MRAESERQNDQQRRYLRNMAIICPMVVGLGLLDAFLPSVFSPISVISMIVRMWACMLPVLVPLLIYRENRLRSGDSLHCPSCDYEFMYGSDAAQPHAERCPECGTEWQDKWIKGRRGGSVIRMRVFLVCGVVGLMVAGVNASRSLTVGARFTPTWLLVHHLLKDEERRSYRFDAMWTELASRSVDATSEAALVDAGIASLRRDSRGFTSRAMESWMTGVLSSGRLPSRTLARYLDERVTSSLTVESGKDGSLDAVLRVIDHDDGGYGDMRLVLARCWIEPSGTDLAIQDGWYGAAFMAANAPEPRDTTLMALPNIADTNPSFRVPLPIGATANPQQVQRVRATVWLFWSPGRFIVSRIAPEDLVADPTLDPSIELIRTVELTADVPQRKP